MGTARSRPFSPREIAFGSFAIYPRKADTGLDAARARTILLGIKKNAVDITIKPTPPRYIDVMVDRLADAIPSSPLATIFDNPNAILVPVPGHGVTDYTYLWSSKIVCEAMKAAGLGSAVHRYVKRFKGVQKAATAPPGERPTPLDHYTSMVVTAALEVPDDILVVDDILTHGCTIAGACARLQEAFPKARIRAFTIARTDSLSKFPFIDPHAGRILVDQDGSWADREKPTGSGLFG